MVVENDTNFKRDVFKFGYAKLSMNTVIVNRQEEGEKKTFSQSETNLGEIHFYKKCVLKPCNYQRMNICLQETANAVKK